MVQLNIILGLLKCIPSVVLAGYHCSAVLALAYMLGFFILVPCLKLFAVACVGMSREVRICEEYKSLNATKIRLISSFFFGRQKQ